MEDASRSVWIWFKKIVESLDCVWFGHDLVRTTEGFYDTALNEADDV